MTKKIFCQIGTTYLFRSNFEPKEVSFQNDNNCYSVTHTCLTEICLFFINTKENFYDKYYM